MSKIAFKKNGQSTDIVKPHSFFLFRFQEYYSNLDISDISDNNDGDTESVSLLKAKYMAHYNVKQCELKQSVRFLHRSRRGEFPLISSSHEKFKVVLFSKYTEATLFHLSLPIQKLIFRLLSFQADPQTIYVQLFLPAGEAKHGGRRGPYLCDPDPDDGHNWYRLVFNIR